MAEDELVPDRNLMVPLELQPNSLGSLCSLYLRILALQTSHRRYSLHKADGIGVPARLLQSRLGSLLQNPSKK